MKIYKISALLGLVFWLMASTAVTAAVLESRLGGLAYYDPDQDITWYYDASTSGNNGNWISQQNYIENVFNVAGVTDWRLPVAGASPTDCPGVTCVGNEMGYLFHVHGVTSAAPDVFSNVFADWFFSGTPSGSDVWLFSFLTGTHMVIDQNTPHQGANGFVAYTWAVHDGDVLALVTPLPATVWMFGTALMGIVGLRRRKKL